MSFWEYLGYAAPVFTLNLEAHPTTITMKYKEEDVVLPLVVDDATIRGTVVMEVPPGKTIAHNGIKIELIGQIESRADRGNPNVFSSVSDKVSKAGEAHDTVTIPFNFKEVQKPFESYNGTHCRLRYFLRVAIVNKYAAPTTKEFDLWVHKYQIPPEINNPIKLEVGIEECLHIEFEYAHSKFHLKDCLVGKVFFMKARIRIKHMELCLLRRETVGAGIGATVSSEAITHFELMDGNPVRGECIPVRFFLGGFDLTPTMKAVNNKFSVKYFVNLVVVDEEDRSYFKGTEITLWRRAPRAVRRALEERARRAEESSAREVEVAT